MPPLPLPPLTGGTGFGFGFIVLRGWVVVGEFESPGVDTLQQAPPLYLRQH